MPERSVGQLPLEEPVDDGVLGVEEVGGTLAVPVGCEPPELDG